MMSNFWPFSAGRKAAGQDGHPYGSEQGDGSIYLSIDSGATWSRTTALTNRNWASIAISADGAKLVAAEKGESGVGGSIYTSRDSGASWLRTSAPINNWTAIASSADGIRLVAAATSRLSISDDAGTNWAPSDAPAQFWSAIRVSADASTVVAVGDGPICILRSPPPVPPLPPSPVLSIGMSSATPAVSWLVPSTSFALQQRSDLSSSNWADVTNRPALNFVNLHQELTLGHLKQVFYRLKEQ
jgi:hypothetical protein